MCRLPAKLLVCAAVLTAPAIAQGDVDPKIIRRGKRATALVVVPGRGFGSAFCIDPAGFLVTNQHVVRRTPIGETVKLVLEPGTEAEKIVEAVVVRADKDADLALLHARQLKKHASLELGDVKELAETQQLVAFGYPFGTPPAVKKKEYPNISVNLRRITSLRRSKGKLERIQLDAQLGPGNSGGPVLDADGNVVGIVNTGVLKTGANFAVPITHLDRFLQKPEIVFDPSPVEFAKRHQATRYSVRVVSFGRKKPQYDVRLTLSDGRADRRQFVAEAGQSGAYTVNAVPVPPRKGKTRVPAEISFNGDLIRGEIEDRRLKVGKIATRLSDVRRIRREGEKWRIVTNSSEEATLKSLKLKDLKIHVGGTAVAVDPSKVESITLRPRQPSDRIPYTVEVRLDEKVAATRSGELAIKGRPVEVTGEGTLARPSGRYKPPREKPQFSGDLIEFRLPQAYTSCTLGGYGRYLAFHLKEAQEVAVLDLLRAQIVHRIPDVSDDVLLAGGAENLLLVVPGQKLMQRWSLKTFKREKVATLPGTGTARIALLGANSCGPLLVGANDAVLVDIDKMEPIEVDGKVIGGSGKWTCSLCGSANGESFAGIPRGYGPVSYTHMQIRGNTTTLRSFGSTSHAVRWAQPTADGSLVTMPGGGIYTSNLEKVAAKWLEGSTLFPTVDPRFFLSVRFAKDEKEGEITQVNICTTADRRIVHTVVGLKEMAPHGNTNSRRSIADHLHYGQRRYHYVPWANLLVNLHYDNQRVFIRRFDLMKTLDESGKNYLFPVSVPPGEAAKGTTCRYQVDVKSKAGGVKFKLESAPEGMTISKTGKLRWAVPPDFEENVAHVVLLVGNASGKEVFHAFDVAIPAKSD